MFSINIISVLHYSLEICGYISLDFVAFQCIWDSLDTWIEEKKGFLSTKVSLLNYFKEDWDGKALETVKMLWKNV